MTADEDHVRVRFRHACGDGADSDFGNEFDGDTRFRIGVAQIIDELCKVFD